MKPVKAWAVLSDSETTPGVYELWPWGNGKQFQYSIFDTRKAAKGWLGDMYGCRIVRVIISEAKAKKAKRKVATDEANNFSDET